MTDIADLADDEVGGAVDRAMRNIDTRREAEATGFCLSPLCGEAVDPPKRWCDADCRDDWQRHQRRKA